MGRRDYARANGGEANRANARLPDVAYRIDKTLSHNTKDGAHVNIIVGRACMALAFTTALSPAAHAQINEPAEDEPAKADAMIVTGERLALQETPEVGTRLGVSLLDTPAAISVIGQDQMQRLGRVTLTEAVRGHPGLIAAERPGAAGVFSYRGFAENNGGLLFDGVRVQSATFTMRNYDAFNFSRIEVLRGPAGALYGEGAGAGAINFVTRAPREGAIAAEFLGQVGSFEQRRFGAAASGTLAGPLDFSVSAVKADYDTFVEGNSHNNLHAIAGLDLRIGERTRLSVSVDYLDNSVDDAYWGQPVIAGRPVPSLRRVNYNRSPDNAYEDEVLWTRLRLDHEFSDSLTYRGQAWRYEADRRWRSFFGFEYVAGPPERVVIRAVENLQNDHEFLGTRHDLTWRGDLGGNVSARLLVGTEASWTDFASPRSYAPNALRPVVDLRQPASRPFAPLSPPREDARRAEVDNLSFFAEGLLDIGDRLLISGGINWLSTRADVSRPSAGVAFEQDREPVNVRLGAVFKANPFNSLYVNFGTGGEPASDSVLILAPGDASLRLTKVEQIEIGTKHALLGGRLELTTALFSIDKDDISSVSPTVPSELQVGSQTSRGFEAALAWDVSRRLRVDANIAYVDADLTVRDGPVLLEGVRPPNAPEWVANALVEAMPIDGLTIGANAHVVSRRFGNNANSVTLDGYTVADFYARYDVSDRIDLTVRVKNLTDEVYAQWATVGFGQVAAYFGPPRTVEMMVRARL